MGIIEPVKQWAERATGYGNPSREEALTCVEDCNPLRLKFRDDGYVPNNSKLPLLYYRRALRFGRKQDAAAVLERVFETHGWGDIWRNGIYDFVHYHPMIHEVLGVASGSAALRLGGNKGRTIKVSAGDVIVIPAGVGHECLTATTKFVVVGGYPPSGTYSESRGSFQEHNDDVKKISRVRAPKKHPIYGQAQSLW